MMAQNYTHTTVLLTEAVDGLAIKSNGCYIDGTYGRGGHSQVILNQLGPGGRLYAFDKDPQAVASKLQDSRLTLIQASFAELKSHCQTWDILGQVDGILLDLGVSSPQFDDPQRGFSFTHAGPLDMRMDPSQGVSAADWINQASEVDIADVLYYYGEERYSRRIAKAIVTARVEQRITNTVMLANMIKTAHPKWEPGKHPATQSFQAIRIFINRELDDLKQLLSDSDQILVPGGRLVVISFHSLEDRLVKQFLKPIDNTPRDIPIESQPHKFKPLGKLIKPTMQEIQMNPRARSAVLRIGEKVS